MRNKTDSRATLPTSRTAATLQRELAAGRLNSVALVQEALHNIRQHKNFNIFITVDETGSLAAAKKLDGWRQQGKILGPLHGLPLVVKDNIFVAGLPNTAGTPALRDFTPATDAPVIERLKAAGAIVLGKTNLHELAYGITSNNFAWGPVRNAREPQAIAGGSSGGTAAAIALDIASIGLGTDTGGSCRIPAALNGVVGFRPTTGRYPAAGLTAISHTRDTVGSMAHTVADVSLLDALLSDSADELPTVALRGLRLGVPRAHFYAGLEARVAATTEALLQQLAAAGVELVAADPHAIGALNDSCSLPVVIYETGQLLPAFLAEHLPGVSFESLLEQVASPDVREIISTAAAGAIDPEAYRTALTVQRPLLQQLYRQYFAENRLDAVIFPTTPLPAVTIEHSLDEVTLGGESVPVFPAFIRNTDPASNAGLPALTLPLSVPAGQLPIGIEINGPDGTDRQLLAIGAALESLIAAGR